MIQKLVLHCSAVAMLLLQQSFIAQTTCNNSGNLIIYSNYDGGIINIDVNVNIPNLKIGICSYEAASVNITGAFASNVTAVVYAGSNSNSDNCSLGVFNTSITGVSSTITTINTTPTLTYTTYHSNGGFGSIDCGYQCDTITSSGGCNTPDELVYYFMQATGGVLRSHHTQYGCWNNTTFSVSSGGNCCILPAISPFCTPPSPPTNTTSSLNSAVCQGNSTTLSAISSFSINWYTTPNGTTSIGSGTSATVPATLSAGTYTYYASATNTCNTSVTRSLIGFTIFPTPSLSISLNTATICPGKTNTLTVTGASTYSWSNGSAGNSIQVSPQVTTTYSVTGTNTLTGCSSSTFQTVNVHPLPAVTLTLANTMLCVNGSTAALVGNPAGGNYSGSNVTGNSFNPGTTPGNYNALYNYTSTTTGCSSTASVQIMVNALPQVTLTSLKNTACVLNPSITLSGSPQGGIYSGANVTGASFLPGANAGTFVQVYTYTNTNTGCSNTQTNSIVVLACTGVNEQEVLLSKVIVSPNPSSGIFNVSNSEAVSLEISVYDLTGKLVYKKQNESRAIIVDLSELNNGLYYCHLNFNNTSRYIKLIKE